jgi:HSP20 family molecular chaperone IbpA
MTDNESEKAQSVSIVDADVLDEMTETNSLIAQRAFEIYQARGSEQVSDRDEWFSSEEEMLPEFEIDFDVSDNAVRLTAQTPGFTAKDLEVIIGHRRAVICGIHSDNADNAASHKKIMRIVELPFDVDSVGARATLQNGKLNVVLPRLAEEESSPLNKAAGL